MLEIAWGAMFLAAVAGSAAILVSMYFLLPALGLPRLDFASITAGWVRVKGRYAFAVGTAIFLLGGMGWAFLYAAFWPWRGAVGGGVYALVPFAISCMTVLPELSRFRAMIQPMPGFVWVQEGGPMAVVASLVEHLVFGLIIGTLY